MKRRTAVITSLILIILLSTAVFPRPASAGVSEWSAETTPGVTDNVLGPSGIDICDYAIGNDDTTIYAVTGDSITDNVTYKSTNAGVSWTALPVSIRADLIAIAPDDPNLIVIANNSTAEVRLSPNGGTTWYSLGVPQFAGQPATTIRDIAVSGDKNGKHYITAAGHEAGSTGNLWYYAYGETAASWQGTKGLDGFTGNNEVAAAAFSPDFSSDATIAAVTANTSTGVLLQLFNLDALKWNVSAAYPNYPCTVVSTTTMTGLQSASLALSPVYDGGEETDRNLFIGLTINGDATAAAASGIYRFMDETKASILANKQVHSVAFNGTYVIAGLYDSTTVYRIQSPMTSSPTTKTSTTTKNPGGDGRVKVEWLGSIVTAGAAGNESAFSISSDSGTTFNDISLIDTEITNARDAAVSASGAKVYYVTDDGADTSLWYKSSSGWSRVFSLKGSTDFIVRVERTNANAVYLAKKDTIIIYYNSSSGAAAWQARTCKISVTDMAVESAQVVYVLNSAGKVTKSANAGLFWSAEADTNLASGGMLYSVSVDNLLAGSQNGYAAYSTDGSATWTRIPQAFNPGAGKIHVIPDQNFATNKTIYAASESPGQSIMKWQINTSTAWTDIFNGNVAGGIYGLAVSSDTLYALEFNGTQSTLWRFMEPLNATSTSTDWIAISTTNTTDADDTAVHLNATPQALKASTSKLWAVKTNDNNKLYSFTDSVTDITINLGMPQDNFSNHVNGFTGWAADIGFTWERPGVATEYEVRMSLDPEFNSLAASVIVTSSENPVFVLIGPYQTGDHMVNFMPGTTYYWKIRTTKPGFSLYSISRSFSIEPILLAGMQLIAPANGATIKSINPAFSWEPSAGATEYEFMLCDNISMSSPLLNAKVEGAGIQIARELEQGKTYFWRVRTSRPSQSEWSTVANFMVAKAAPAAVTPTETTTIIMEIPQQTSLELVFPPAEPPVKTSPGYLVITMFIMAALTASVLLLVFARPGGIFNRSRATDDPGSSRVYSDAVKKPVGTAGKAPERAAEARTPRLTAEKKVSPLPKPAAPDEGKAAPPPVNSKEAEAVIFAAKSFMWMEDKEAGGEADKERVSLGKKLAGRIKELAGKEPLHIRHAEDAAMLFNIWARFGSKNETSRYLADSMKAMADNAIRLIKCYLPPDIPRDTGDPAALFTRDSYKALAEVIEPEKVYAALTKIFKFKTDVIEETAPVKPADRNIAFKFMRLHLQEKA